MSDKEIAEGFYGGAFTRMTPELLRKAGERAHREGAAMMLRAGKHGDYVDVDYAEIERRVMGMRKP